MPNPSRLKLQVFEVGYKCYYHELSDWARDHIRAKDKKNALRIFASRHYIKARRGEQAENWRWWDGDWYMSFRYIHEVEQTPKPCPRCHGMGTVLASGV